MPRTSRSRGSFFGATRQQFDALERSALHLVERGYVTIAPTYVNMGVAVRAAKGEQRASVMTLLAVTLGDGANAALARG